MTTLAEFYSRKDRVRYYRTLEIYHPTIGTQRYVDGRIDPLNFTLEASAPRNASASVEFLGGAFSFIKPDQGNPNLYADIQLGRVGKQVKQQLKSIRGADRALTGEVILREYLGGQLGAPVFVLRLYISTITLTAEGVVIRAEQSNPADRSVSEFYTSDRFPGLAEAL